MKSRSKLTVLIFSGFVLSACTFGGQNLDTQHNSNSDAFNSSSPVASEHYNEYTPDAFEAALASGKPIFINFHANWCPTCKLQNRDLNQLFGADAEVQSSGIEGFFVNILDNETSDAEKELALRYGVTSQHTYIYINSSGEVVNKTIGTRTEKQIRDDLQSIAK
ncbi:MAG: hypothetical protein COT81_02075 [Candidatus Buchananbacteria bacterium CG10_big_fil_rev_8_21_14_0_10_42_9]|uniref:Thioredoxin domain-containing protein n=1 Tax=Candidatus Buchananbacteria bacterium CG10_big_fil_rev_8_21_14_0_10_42_9 TaxID=1974526 RepID=A0A2H0W1L4_9BACT|nr:MAG: hypothetical protein COT81_02075 [Candidatus Buchananbacteria bacterium CG10_big_fil_rev_8_21_14_0_10_42_9]